METIDENMSNLRELITPIEQPLNAMENYDPAKFMRGVSREEGYKKIVVDSIVRDNASMEKLYEIYINKLPWADDVLIRILANQHYDKALEMAKEIDADPNHEYHKKI